MLSAFVLCWSAVLDEQIAFSKQRELQGQEMKDLDAYWAEIRRIAKQGRRIAEQKRKISE
jgi:hypothetical protein